MAEPRGTRGTYVGILAVAEGALRHLHRELGHPESDPVTLEAEAMALINGLYGAGWYLHRMPELEMIEITRSPE